MEAHPYWAVFSDGSASVKTRDGGWAYLAFDLEDNELSASGWVPDTTIGAMELFAPTQALFELFCRHGRCNVMVFCDSQYVVKGITDRSRKRLVNREFWKLLDRNTDLHKSVVYEHVEGHSGSYYNERVDGLAVAARMRK